MYIMNSEGTQIINSEFIERFLISEKPDAVLVVLSYGNERPAKTLARYKDLREAKSAMGDLMAALAGGQAYFTMPESILFAQERIKHDARTKRKGGS